MRRSARGSCVTRLRTEIRRARQKPLDGIGGSADHAPTEWWFPSCLSRGGFPMRATSWVLGPALLLVFFVVVPAADEKGEKSGVNEEGFVQQWLVLAPIPLEENQSGAEGLDKEQVKEEAKLKPKAGDKVKAGNKELAWKEHTCKEHLLDFNALLGNQTEDSVAYAVTFIVAP